MTDVEPEVETASDTDRSPPPFTPLPPLPSFAIPPFPDFPQFPDLPKLPGRESPFSDE